ncbi:glutamine amidotransferase [Roseicella aquatilis]|uniref:Glutamine amidotransferase n=1 Tax=Roseicella aquatilis TaxID=2527868 RepID=A0A4R4DKH9_9PROT|nr:glutamine amidotransferase [Roseicella aquatilis]TCZ61310.1 glutamine amidotransferase [Roseicella aquatilis]
MAPLLIIRAGSTFPAMIARMGDFSDWIAAGLGAPSVPVQVVDPRHEALPADASGVVITGSHAMVTDREAWSEAVARWLPGLIGREVPVLGICYGHQLLAHALGGAVAFHPEGIEIGTVRVRRTGACAGDPVLGHLPDSFPAQAIHRQTVATLPPGAEVLAANDVEPHHAVRYGRLAWGVQFHPEFSAEAMRGTIDHLAAELARDGLDPAALDAAVGPTPEAARVLQAFGALVEECCLRMRAGRQRPATQVAPA